MRPTQRLAPAFMLSMGFAAAPVACGPMLATTQGLLRLEARLAKRPRRKGLVNVASMRGPMRANASSNIHAAGPQPEIL